MKIVEYNYEDDQFIYTYVDVESKSGSGINLRDCTGWSIKNGSHSFNHTCSHDRNPSNFKTVFICYYTELSFEVYNAFLGQLA